MRLSAGLVSIFLRKIAQISAQLAGVGDVQTLRDRVEGLCGCDVRN
jgi:hypothetical protein